MLVIVLKNIFVSHVDLDGRREEVSHSSLWTVKTDSLKRNDKKHILFNIVQPNGRSILRPTLQTAIVQRRYETVFQRIHLETMFEWCVCMQYTIFDISPISFSSGLSLARSPQFTNASRMFKQMSCGRKNGNFKHLAKNFLCIAHAFHK